MSDSISHGHIETRHFGTISIRENDAAPFTGGTNVDECGDPVPPQPELVIHTDQILGDADPNLLRSIRVVDGMGRDWQLCLPDTTHWR